MNNCPAYHNIQSKVIVPLINTIYTKKLDLDGYHLMFFVRTTDDLFVATEAVYVSGDSMWSRRFKQKPSGFFSRSSNAWHGRCRCICCLRRRCTRTGSYLGHESVDLCIA